MNRPRGFRCGWRPQNGTFIEGGISLKKVPSVASIHVDIVTQKDGLLVNAGGHVDISLFLGKGDGDGFLNGADRECQCSRVSVLSVLGYKDAVIHLSIDSITVRVCPFNVGEVRVPTPLTLTSICWILIHIIKPIEAPHGAVGNSKG
jgi:hypothetical protein